MRAIFALETDRTTSRLARSLITPASAPPPLFTRRRLRTYHQEHNFATSSATASSTFRNRQPCTRYTGEGEEFPTGVREHRVRGIIVHGGIENSPQKLMQLDSKHVRSMYVRTERRKHLRRDMCLLAPRDLRLWEWPKGVRPRLTL